MRTIAPTTRLHFDALTFTQENSKHSPYTSKFLDDLETVAEVGRLT